LHWKIKLVCTDWRGVFVAESKHYHIIVIGAGHAGCEAALASARRGFETLLVTGNIDQIGAMSCNPAIGGIGKGHLVREIDALGGEMGKNIDETGIQFRRLNTNKGTAVQGTRAQADKHLYRDRMRWVVENQERLTVKQGLVKALLVESGQIHGVELTSGDRFFCDAVVVTTGTFLRGLCHVGMKSFSGGRAGDAAAQDLSASLMKDCGLDLMLFRVLKFNSLLNFVLS
jgi:tRNA uridine 5-carboxymethylaminomethyl modification enzyme